MVYWMDQKSLQKEPIAILAERRKLERDNNNAIGMLRLARKVFAKTEERPKGLSSEITFNIARPQGSSFPIGLNEDGNTCLLILLQVIN